MPLLHSDFEIEMMEIIKSFNKHSRQLSMECQALVLPRMSEMHSESYESWSELDSCILASDF